MDENRRRLLALLGTAGVKSLAGCGSDGDGETEGIDDQETTTEAPGDETYDSGTTTETPGDQTDDSGATTEIAAPPEKAKLTPEDGDPLDSFGRTVGMSSDGTTAVIGAWQDDDPNGSAAGSAYVFQWEGGEWSEETKLTASDGDQQDHFGSSVGLSGDGTTIVIGAFTDNDPNGEQAGSAYVFQWEGGEWSEETKLVPEDGESVDYFGSSIGLSGDGTTAVIGAYGDWGPNGNRRGSAYVFQRESGGWVEETKLVPEDGDTSDQFGVRLGVSSDGTTAVIGAGADEDPNGSAAGSAYVFQRKGGEWSEETKLVPEDGDSFDSFGSSVGVSSDGTTVVIGAWKDEDPNGEQAGSAYVFQSESGGWVEEIKLAPADGDSEDRFGLVGLSGDGTTVVIGAPRDEDPNGEQAGSAYVFQRERGEWSEETKLAPEDGDAGEQFGFGPVVSSEGTTAVIGTNALSAYVFPLGE